MGLPNIGQQTNIRKNHFLKPVHFSRLGNARFKNTQLMRILHLPNAERNTQLRIETARRPDNVFLLLQQMIEPFFYNGLAIAAGDANHRKFKLFSVSNGQLMQGCHNIIRQ